ncbi:glycosyltransferase [Priestia megaterium]|uniref:glycosyltransferase n=1 Tax=Priestia megaterium TaxID=1404 RepID=UPI0020766D00|nr:glycosyltransferase [Priestia megaterium]USD17468.1 glycosyltransferase [Priestia megaterium]USD18559.1 glycosyltransferase [Priestia megaterium]
MKKIRTLLIISSGYPYKDNPEYTFVDQLVSEFANHEIRCIVIAPYSISKRIIRKNTPPPVKSQRETISGKMIEVYRPRYVSFSSNLFSINTSVLTYNNFKRAVLKELRSLNVEPDAVYGHFIAMSGMCAADIGELLNVPSFLAYGESSVQNFLNFNSPFLRSKLNKLAGIISVSTENKRELLELGLIDNPDIIEVFPNGIDPRKFYKVDKQEARNKLGICEEKFVVAFVGGFIERKGIGVLCEVIGNLQDVYALLIGRGPIEPSCKNLLHQGPVNNEDLYLYLNAADIFVLPTLAEGCCNAIIEAMACGLPIVSSDKEFNDDILSEKNSIRVDSKNTKKIQEAINTLKVNNKLRKEMSAEALKSAAHLNIETRAKMIISFMETKLNYKKEE